MEVGRALNLVSNLAIPAAGGAAGIFITNIQNPETGFPTIIGTALFGMISGFGSGERSHRYVGGVIAQVVPLFIGMTIPDRRYDQFEFAPFFIATAVSITVQIVLREITNLPEALKKGGRDGAFHAPSSFEPVADDEGSEELGGSGPTGGSSAISPYGVSKKGTLSTFVPQMTGLEVANPGTVIIGVEEEEHTRRHLIEGNTTIRRKKYKTAEGGTLDEHTYEHSGWFGSEKKNRREYIAGSGTYGSTTSTDVKGPQIEEVD